MEDGGAGKVRDACCGMGMAAVACRGLRGRDFPLMGHLKFEIADLKLDATGGARERGGFGRRLVKSGFVRFCPAGGENFFSGGDRLKRRHRTRRDNLKVELHTRSQGQSNLVKLIFGGGTLTCAA